MCVYYCRLGSLLALSIVLIAPGTSSYNSVVAVVCVLTFVFGFALGLGAGNK